MTDSVRDAGPLRASARDLPAGFTDHRRIGLPPAPALAPTRQSQIPSDPYAISKELGVSYKMVRAHVKALAAGRQGSEA